MHSCPKLVLLPGTLYRNISTQTCFALDFFTCITIDAYPSVALVVITMVYINIGARIVSVHSFFMLFCIFLFYLYAFIFSFDVYGPPYLLVFYLDLNY